MKSQSYYVQLTFEDLISEIKTKPTYIESGLKIYENNELLQFFEEMRDETFSVRYENELFGFVLPICLGEVFHYVSGIYETEFSIATGKNEISRTKSICFAGGGEMLRKIIVDGDKVNLVSDTVDWNSKLVIPHSASNWSQLYFSDKGEIKKSTVEMQCESYEMLNGTLPKRKNTLDSEHIVEFLKGQNVVIEVDNIKDEIINKIVTIPVKVKKITIKGDTLKVGFNQSCFLEIKQYCGLAVNPNCITATVTKKENPVYKTYIHIK